MDRCVLRAGIATCQLSSPCLLLAASSCGVSRLSSTPFHHHHHFFLLRCIFALDGVVAASCCDLFPASLRVSFLPQRTS